MSYEIQVRRAAEVDLAEAQVLYETEWAGLGAEFRSEVSHVINRLADTPLIYQIVHSDVRRAVFRRFPYLMWYRVDGRVVTIIACTHAKGDPEEVKTRISDA